jgi:anti-sigma regulatory factor (Ser/Thr protein kinase)
MGFGAGMGLSNMKKNSDMMKISSVPGEGTIVEMTTYIKPNAG